MNDNPAQAHYALSIAELLYQQAPHRYPSLRPPLRLCAFALKLAPNTHFALIPLQGRRSEQERWERSVLRERLNGLTQCTKYYSKTEGMFVLTLALLWLKLVRICKPAHAGNTDRRIALGRLIFHCKTAYKTDIIGKRLLAISPARCEPSNGGRITQLS